MRSKGATSGRRQHAVPESGEQPRSLLMRATAWILASALLVGPLAHDVDATTSRAAKNANVPQSAQPLARHRTVAAASAPGEDFGSAIVIPFIQLIDIPFTDSGNTCASLDEYTPPCAFGGNSAAPDVVYVVQPTNDVRIEVTLCGSGFDTVLHVYESGPSGSMWCNDDYCGLQSRLVIDLAAGNAYYIVVDGWGSECGDYLIRVDSLNPLVSGTVMYYTPSIPNQNRVSGASICLDPPATTCTESSSGGLYKLMGPVPGFTTLAATRTPDPTDSRAIGGGDVSLFVEFLADQLPGPLTADQAVAADVDGSGVPNVADLQLIKRWLVFDFSACPACATWNFYCDPLVNNETSPCIVAIPGWSNVTLDLKGILKGDLDGSWPGRSKAVRGVPKVTFGSAEWHDSEVVVPVLVDTRKWPLETLIFSVQYEPQVLQFLSAGFGGEPNAFDLTLNSEQTGSIHGLLARGAMESTSSSPTLALRFRTLAVGAATRISFSRLLVNDQSAELLPATFVSRSEQTETAPLHFQMNAQPNPFNPVTSIRYTIPAGEPNVLVQLRILDLSGRLVGELVSGLQAPGRYEVNWDGKGRHGEVLASGVYLLQLHAGGQTSALKLVLLK
jgi:hypothetical protein